MAIKYSFVDGVAYGTDDINKLTNVLVGAGISPFRDADTYNVSDLNVLTEALVSQGVRMGGCVCSVEYTDAVNMSISVSKGVVFFDNGVRLEVDDGGYEIIVDANKAGYVFAYFDPSLQIGDILFDEQVRTVGKSVVLAHIDEYGTVTDLREIARSKIASFGKNVMQKYPFSRVSEVIRHNDGFVIAKIPGVDVERFNFAILSSTQRLDDDELVYFPDVGRYIAFFDIVGKKNCFSICPSGDNLEVEKITYFYKNARGFSYYPEIIGGELCIVCKCSENEVMSAVTHAYGSTACFM